MKKLIKDFLYDGDINDLDLNKIYLHFCIKPKGYGKCSKEIRKYIDFLQDECFKKDKELMKYYIEEINRR